jgi:hypothetical protein
MCTPVDLAKLKIDGSKRIAKRGGYAPVKIGVASLIKLMQDSHICVGCKEPLNWDEGEDGRMPCLHHNHKTGEVIGFAHNRCNWLEGMINKFGYDLISKLVKNFGPKTA